jgi:integrase
LDLGPRPCLVVEPARQRSARLKTEGSARPVPLPDELAAVLRAWTPHAGPVWLFPGVKRVGPWDGGAPGSRPLDALRAEAKAVGIPRVTWHSLRHAYATAALERWQLPPWVVQRVMGHSDPRTTARYQHLAGSAAVAEAARAVSYGAAG